MNKPLDYELDNNSTDTKRFFRMSHRYMSTFQGYSSSKIYLPAENISVCIWTTFYTPLVRKSLTRGGSNPLKLLSTVKGWRGLVVGTLRVGLGNTSLDKLSEPGSVDLVEVLLHEAAESWTVDFIEVLLVEAVEAAAVDFIHVPLLIAEGISTRKKRQEKIKRNKRPKYNTKNAL